MTPYSYTTKIPDTFADPTYFPNRLFKSVYINVEAEVSIVCGEKE